MGSDLNKLQVFNSIDDFSEFFDDHYKSIPVIGFTGAKYSGKSTVVKKIMHIDMHSSFAAPLKVAANNMVGMFSPYEHDKEDTIEGLGISWRQLWQRLGDFGRELDNDFWINAWLRQVKKFTNARTSPYVVSVDDVRFSNEADIIHSLGGKVVWVINPELQESNDNHKSELGIPTSKIDYIIINKYKKPVTVLNDNLF